MRRPARSHHGGSSCQFWTLPRMRFRATGGLVLNPPHPMLKWLHDERQPASRSISPGRRLVGFRGTTGTSVKRSKMSFSSSACLNFTSRSASN